MRGRNSRPSSRPFHQQSRDERSGQERDRESGRGDGRRSRQEFGGRSSDVSVNLEAGASIEEVKSGVGTFLETAETGREGAMAWYVDYFKTDRQFLLNGKNDIVKWVMQMAERRDDLHDRYTDEMGSALIALLREMAFAHKDAFNQGNSWFAQLQMLDLLMCFVPSFALLPRGHALRTCGWVSEGSTAETQEGKDGNAGLAKFKAYEKRESPSEGESFYVLKDFLRAFEFLLKQKRVPVHSRNRLEHAWTLLNTQIVLADRWRDPELDVRDARLDADISPPPAYWQRVDHLPSVFFSNPPLPERTSPFRSFEMGVMYPHWFYSPKRPPADGSPPDPDYTFLSELRYRAAIARERGL
eukprot:Cvel_957.t1-p1 / transcript=Cvel_957.t1 / gene=Cvel_957 / organism=Chromera_velia_CCMP2878 / gene_product=hypothetical protein / transcript_product=hypothetical protein / location=Cvel_scaffold31:1-1607(-) / protein_length=355 / sequence_SO=supercontig / SO=protein_coding / is_pseudo=false